MDTSVPKYVMSAGLTLALLISHPLPLPAQTSVTPEADGRHTFVTRCAVCHGTTGNGGEFAPSIISRIPLRSDDELKTLLHEGIASAGMPGFSDVVDSNRENLIRYLRTLKPDGGMSIQRTKVSVEGGKVLEGVELNRSDNDLQMLGDDHQLHLLRKINNETYRSVTSQVDWPGYDGANKGQRFSAIDQITPDNAKTLQPKWLFTIPNIRELQTTPIVVDGVMYVTSGNHCVALDAGNGRQVWHYERSRTLGASGVALSPNNRGAAVNGDKVYFVTDNNHLLALNRTTGKLVWETVVADWHDNYKSSGAPLIADNLVVTGIAGGDEGARGFLAAFDQQTGKEVWRFWTVPKPGEPGSETWKGSALQHPGGSTWMTGSFDKDLDTIYWPVGNPGPDLIGDQRLGDNLYTDSILALDPKSGKLKWFFQFTPHDVHDFDAMAPSAQIDAMWEGKPRKLLVQANRNGFLYVLDRTNGKFLFGTAYSKKISWASGLTPGGRPIVIPDQDPTEAGKYGCPWLNGASNWYSSSYNPGTGLYYVQTNDKCGIFTRTEMEYRVGGNYMGGSFSPDPNDPGKRILRAFDIHTGKPVWELPQTGGAAETWGGVLSTAGNVVFFGADDGAFAAADAKTGKLLWSFQTNQTPHASPITYLFDHKQYIAVAYGPNIIAFGLPD